MKIEIVKNKSKWLRYPYSVQYTPDSYTATIYRDGYGKNYMRLTLHNRLMLRKILKSNGYQEISGWYPTDDHNHTYFCYLKAI